MESSTVDGPIGVMQGAWDRRWIEGGLVAAALVAGLALARLPLLPVVVLVLGSAVVLATLVEPLAGLGLTLIAAPFVAFERFMWHLPLDSGQALLMLTLGAILSKIIGAGAGGLLSGFNRLSSLRLGIGMVSRGEVGLIVAALGISNGIIGEETFAAVVLVVLVTTVITPPLVRWSFAKSPQETLPDREQTEILTEGE